jgi:hypothetical protein
MRPTEKRSPMHDSDLAQQRAAFRELHGARLHGFALLLTLGDRRLAALLAADAIAAGSGRIAELRHPERAAAWLRRRVVRGLGGRALMARGGGPPDLPDELAELGADEASIAGLAALDTRGRAAIVASSVERLDPRDVAAIVGVRGARLDRLLRRVAVRYAAAVLKAQGGVPADGGPIIDRVRSVAMRALA